MTLRTRLPAPRRLPPLLPLDDRSAEPLQRQLYRGLREAILTGRIAPGALVSSTRALASELSVSRTTVVLAYEQLAAEGYLSTARGSGTRVASELPVRGSAVASRRPSAPARRAPRLSRRGDALSAIPSGGIRVAPAARPFRAGIPALELFPTSLWARLVSRRARRLSLSLLDYGDGGGYRPLRESIAAHVAGARGVECDWTQVIIMPGAFAAIDLVVRILLDAGDQVWIEEPGYLGARAAFAANGVRVMPVRVDAEGIDVPYGRARAPSARLAYVTPSHQYPLGMTMSLPRRLALLGWARTSAAWIVEDDYDSEYRYGGRPLPALYALDQHERVIYLGTFSKTMFPSLRLAFLVVPRGLAESFRLSREAGDQQPPALEQAALADFIAEGHFARHVRRMRAQYAARREALIAAAAREASQELTLDASDTGIHAIAWLPAGVSDRDVAARAAALGVEATALSTYYLGPPRAPGLVLGFAAVRPRDVAAGMRVLRDAVRASRRAR